jgi:hypothetical protein
LEFNEWPEEEADRHAPPKKSGPDLLVGSVRKATRAEILASIPPRSIVDVLVEHVLALGDIASGIDASP